MYILNASEPFAVETSNGAASMAVTVPSDIARDYIAGVDDLCGAEHVGDATLVSTFTGLVRGILRNDTAADPVWLRDICLQLPRDTINPRIDRRDRRSWRSSDAARTLLLDTVQRVIRNRMRDKDFSISVAASECLVSERHLQSMFQGIGTTFTQTLFDARLDHAAAMLRSADRGLKRIGQIAEECGFRSQAHFSTLYKARFGVSPRDENVVNGRQ